MKKLFYFIAIVMCLFLFISADMLDTEEFKFVMQIPPGFEFDTYEEGRWGGIDGYEEESETTLVAYAYMGKTTKEKI